MVSWRELHAYSDLLGTPGNGSSVLNTPMRLAPVVFLDAQGRRAVTPMRWGWIDARAPDPFRKPGMMHARGETLDVRPLWKHAFAEGRGVVWADTFNIGEELPSGKVKQWRCRRADGKPVAIAVLWERWDHPERGSLHVFVPVTTDSPPSVHSKDERFPLLLSSEDEISLWLGEDGAPPECVKSLIRPFGGELIVEEEARPQAPKRARGSQQDLFRD